MIWKQKTGSVPADHSCGALEFRDRNDHIFYEPRSLTIILLNREPRSLHNHFTTYYIAEEVIKFPPHSGIAIPE